MDHLVKSADVALGAGSLDDKLTWLIMHDVVIKEA